MKERLQVVAIVVFIVLGLFWFRHTPARKGPVGSEMDGFKVNACYELKQDDPFSAEKVIMQILDIKEKHIQYRYYLDWFFGYGLLHRAAE